ncbi:MAG: hypothetical protein M0027_04405 [Candidatus Dormibacteraeota bacterium]|jgi:hypothetical protein|nr:hypothetical protein [Candidatus Dormibacteraeota bacterium]
MARVVFYRLLNAGRASADDWREGVATMASSRSWRCEPMWLATDSSKGIFESEYLRHLRRESAAPLVGAGFVKLAGDETDALAVSFSLLHMTAELGGKVVLTDPENPIHKQRVLELIEGRVTGTRSIDEVMVSGPIFKRLPAATITFYPPRYQARTMPGPSGPPGRWRFSLQGLQAEASGFLEAEAEAMRIYRGLQAIG